MRLKTRFGLAWMLACWCVAPSLAGDVSDYVTKEGQLKHQLELRDQQRGPFGVITTSCVIEPAGDWHVKVDSLGSAKVPAPRKGQLNKQQLAALANHLAAQGLLSLPKQVGVVLEAKRELTITFGGKSTTLPWKLLKDLTEAAPDAKDAKAAEWSRFVSLVLVIQHWTRNQAAD